jgi:hypothetical protein
MMSERLGWLFVYATAALAGIAAWEYFFGPAWR